MINTWMISDTHFYHDNIIKYENRPFKGVHDMNKQLIINWNNKIRKDDKVIHLGDFGLGKTDDLKNILSQLNGHKILIRGNHDRSRQAMLNMGFDEVYDYPIIYKGFYILSHEPLYVDQNMPYVNIHGHIHGNKMNNDHYYNMCVEHHEYAPVNFMDIQKIYEKEEDK